MKKHKGHGHTGKIVHPHMRSIHQGGMGGKDPHADPAHHKHNNEHGMPEGLSPKGAYDGEAGMESGGEGMSENGECCE